MFIRCKTVNGTTVFVPVSFIKEIEIAEKMTAYTLDGKHYTVQDKHISEKLEAMR